MTATGATSALRRRRSWRLALVVLAAGAVLAGTVTLAARRGPATPVPAVDLADPDPAVLAAYRSARDAVLAAPRSAAAWGRYGMFLLAYGFRPESGACFAEAERLDPLEPRWPYYHSQVLPPEDLPQAVADLRRTVDLCGDTPDFPRLRLADLLLEAGRLDEAAAELHQAQAANPGSARAQFGLGRLAAERGDLRGSAEHLRRATASPYTAHAAHALLAQVLGRLGDGPGAERERLQAEADRRPLSWPDPYADELEAVRVGKVAALRRAHDLLEAGRLADARAAVEAVVRDYPDADLAWLLLGQVCLRQGDFGAAGQALQRAVTLSPGSVEAHFELGSALACQGDFPAAAEHFQRATELKPASATAWFNLGRCRGQLGDEAGAVRALAKAVACRPQFAEAHRDLGTLLARRGDRAGALEHLQSAVRLDPRDEEARRRLEEVRKQAGPPSAPAAGP